MTQQQREAVAGIVRNSELLGRAHMNSKSAVPAGRSGASRRTFPVRARDLLKVRAVWILPLILGSAVVVLITAFYVGSVVNPLGHLQGLPVAVVNQDRGAVIGTRQVNIGQQVQRGLSGSTAVSGRLALTDTSLRSAQQAMDRGASYATVVIPPGFTASLLTRAGLSASRAGVRHGRRSSSGPTSGRARSGPAWPPACCSPAFRRHPARSGGSWRPSCPPPGRPAR